MKTELSFLGKLSNFLDVKILFKTVIFVVLFDDKSGIENTHFTLKYVNEETIKYKLFT